MSRIRKNARTLKKLNDISHNQDAVLIFQDEVLVENVAVSKDSSTSKTAVGSRHERLRIISLSEGNRELAERLRRKYPGCDVLQFDSSESFFEWKRDQGFI